MNRTYFALFIALIIHILFIGLFFLLQNSLKLEKKIVKEERRLKISLKDMPVKKKEIGVVEKKIKPIIKKIAPPMPKGSQLKKIIKPKPKPKIIQPIVKKEPIKKIIEEKKKIIKPVQKPQVEPVIKKVVPKKDSVSWMYEDKSSDIKDVKEKKMDYAQNNINQNIKELYGSEFGKLSQGQQKYIIDNQEIMRRITQSVLTRVASVNLNNNLSINRSNIIEFYLHPNGDMTDFRFLQKSGYFTLDETTRETIEYSYSRYPRPKEKTLIRYNVFYNLAVSY